MSAIGAVPAAPIALTCVAGAGWIGRRLLGRPGTGGEPDALGRSGGWCAGRRAPFPARPWSGSTPTSPGALRVWWLSPGRQARQALANGVWPRGTYEYKLRHDGVVWRAPDRSAVFLPWSALAGTCETERLFLLMDAEGRTVRGFIPKAGRSDLPSDAELGRLIRERIRGAIS